MKKRFLTGLVTIGSCLLLGGCLLIVTHEDRPDPDFPPMGGSPRKLANYLAALAGYKPEQESEGSGEQSFRSLAVYQQGARIPSRANPCAYPDLEPELPEGCKKDYSLEGAEPVLAFVHLSDVQIRDEEVRLASKYGEGLLDTFVPSASFGPAQEKYDYAVLLALVQTINAMAAENAPDPSLAPRFAIQTGDAVHTHTLRELFTYLMGMSMLEIPWFDVVGNHDTISFGTVSNTRAALLNPRNEFMSICGQKSFMQLHFGEPDPKSEYADQFVRFGPVSPIILDRAATVRTLQAEDFAAPIETEFHPTTNPSAPVPLSFSTEPTSLRDGHVLTGYYHFTVRTVPPIHCLVLNTSQGGRRDLRLKGWVEADQVEWFREKLGLEGDQPKAITDGLILVFGHHPIGHIHEEGGREAIETAMREQPRVVAYFCGHTHAHNIREHPSGMAREGFWEIITGSVLEWPQWASHVRIFYNQESGEGEIKLRRLRANPVADPLKKLYHKAHESAALDAGKPFGLGKPDLCVVNADLPFVVPR